MSTISLPPAWQDVGLLLLVMHTFGNSGDGDAAPVMWLYGDLFDDGNGGGNGGDNGDGGGYGMNGGTGDERGRSGRGAARMATGGQG
jgi:hypothetical protein